jgi:hypothetical protein
LSFRPWDHQLRQPLYIAAKGNTEEPVAGVDETVRESLDRIGTRQADSACRFGT